jgi:hypothetical protein
MSKSTTTRLIPLTDWPKFHPWPTVRGLRHLVFGEPNGFSVCVRRVGRRVLIDEAAFFIWVENQSNMEGLRHERFPKRGR